ncbi:MAG: S41 family peptidase [Ginsengibacter sp.]
MRNKRLQVWLPLILSLCMVAGMFIGYRIKGNMPNKGIFFVERQKPVQEVLDLIQRKYVDNENLDSLGNLAIQAILQGLDPHSIYLPVQELKEANEDLQGVFYGIGVEFNIINDTTNVLNVLPEGPSEKAGLLTGDKIIKVGDSLIAGNSTSAETLKKLLRGPRGAKVTISILRNNELQSITITRGAIPLFSLDAAYMVNDTIGYIRLNKFSETTYREFMQGMEKLQAKGMTSLIFDLRDNGGGILTEATNIADEFLDGNKLITYTECVNSPRREYFCDKEGIFEKGQLIVLANEGTASASEVIIGALQDYDRAIIVGRRTFGKGLVQEQYELSDGSGLRLTVARYFTPLGRGIQKSYNKGRDAYSKDLINRFTNGEMTSSDSIKHSEMKEYVTGKGKILYAGEGITPYVFVPYDTLIFDKNVMKILMSGMLNEFVYRNYLQNKKQFDAFKNPAEFNKSYKVDDSTFSRLITMAKRDSIQLSLTNPTEKSQISRQIKSLMARQIWRKEGFFEVNNAHDDVVKKAIELLQPQKEKISKNNRK